MSIRIKNSSNVVKKELYYVYDGLGRRIKRQLIDYENPSLSNERRFYYDRDQIVEERNENNQVVTRYMNGTGVDDPLLLINASGVYGYTKDGLGSVKELVKLDQQIPHQRYSYSSYGMTTEALEVVTPDKKPIENRYAYTGRELEHETGLYYYRARYYDPELGRFISEDPIGFSGGMMTFYGYVDGNPTTYRDPSGLKIIADNIDIPLNVKNSYLYKYLDSLIDEVFITSNPSLRRESGTTSWHNSGAQLIQINENNHKNSAELTDTYMHELNHAKQNLLVGPPDGSNNDFREFYDTVILLPNVLKEGGNRCEK